MRHIILFVILSGFCKVQAQQTKTQHNFAQTYFGISAQFSPASGYTHILQPDDKTSKINLPAGIEPRLEIGGLHFWRKADFYISIPIKNFLLNTNENVNQHFSTGIATGARYFPLQIRKNKLRPFAGINWSTPWYWQQQKDSASGPVIRRNTFMLEAGFTYATKKYRLWDFSIQYMPQNNFNYAISREQFANVKLPAISFKLGYKFLFDFTQGNNMEVLNRFYDHLKSEKKLSGFTIAAGPSVAFSTQKSSYLPTQKPFVQNPMPSGFYADLGIGYYFHKPDLELRLSYKSVNQHQEAYNFYHELKTKSVSLEAFKFLFDYKGFVPFAGAAVSYNQITYSENDNGIAQNNLNQNMFAPVLVLGWDIRPTQSEILVLRTNIRYTFPKSLTIGNLSIPLNHLEINFIQLVLYPERIFALKKFNALNNN